MINSLTATPLTAQQQLIFLLQAALLLLLAFLLGRAAVLLKMPAIVGELLAGVVLGPSLLGFLAPAASNWLLPAESEQVRMLDGASQIGVMLLVGVTGSYLDLDLLRRRRATAAAISLAGLVIPLGLGVGLGLVLPASLIPDSTSRAVFALFVGVAMCVTAIPVIAKTLSDLNLLHRDVGQLTLAAAVIDDAFGWFLLSVISAMATIGISAGNVAWSVIHVIGFVTLAFVVARPGVRWIMRLAGRSEQPGPTIAVTVIIVLLAGTISQSLGLEAIFGAFIAGAVIGSVATTDQAKLAPLRTVVLWVLAPLFLAGAGLRMDLTTLADPAIAVAALVLLAVAIIGKFAGAYLGARLGRLNNREALAIGAGMNSRGIVEVVIATVGLRLGVLNIGMYTCIVLIAIVTSLLGPLVMRWAMSKVEQTESESLRQIEHDSWAGSPEPLPKVA